MRSPQSLNYVRSPCSTLTPAEVTQRAWISRVHVSVWGAQTRSEGPEKVPFHFAHGRAEKQTYSFRGTKRRPCIAPQGAVHRQDNFFPLARV